MRRRHQVTAEVVTVVEIQAQEEARRMAMETGVDMPPETQQQAIERVTAGGILLAVFVAALIVVGVIGAWLSYSGKLSFLFTPEEEAGQVLTNREGVLGAKAAVLDGDYATAAQEAEQAASRFASIGNTDEAAAARVVERFALLMQGGTENIQKAIVLAKDDFLSVTTSPSMKASTVNMLLEALTVTRSQAVFDAIFSGPPFESYGIPGDFTGSMDALADLSLSLSPGSIPYWYKALWHTARITNFDKDYQSTRVEKANHARAAVEYAEQAEAEYRREQGVARAFPEVDTMRFFFWKGLIYGAASYTDIAYLTKAQQAYADAEDYYESTLNADGEPTVPFVELRMPYLYINEANLLLNIQKEAVHDEVRSILSKVESMMTKHPTIHERGYATVLRRTAERSGITDSSTSLKRLASISPEFSAFLAGYGVLFQ